MKEWKGSSGEVLRVGDHVRSLRSGREGIIMESSRSSRHLTLKITKQGIGGNVGAVGDTRNNLVSSCFMKITNQTQKEKESDMNKVIAAVYAKDNTEDAVLVEKYFGAAFGTMLGDSFSRTLWLEEHKAEYLDEAQRREKEENAKINRTAKA